MFFFELHEGDNEVYSDVLVVSESEWEPEEFFELVQQIRRRIQDTSTHDTLSEAIAVELEREHGFIYVSDDSLSAAVNVSTVDEDNFLVDLEVDLADAQDDHDDDEIEDDADAIGFRSVLVDFDPGASPELGTGGSPGLAHGRPRSAYLLNRISTRPRRAPGRSCLPSAACPPCAPRPSSRA